MRTRNDLRYCDIYKQGTSIQAQGETVNAN